eukprot:scaffold55357_cov30-Tisochrysis_lutea.AAC.1
MAPPSKDPPERTCWAHASETARRASCRSAPLRCAASARNPSSRRVRYHKRGVLSRMSRSEGRRDGGLGMAAATAHKMSDPEVVPPCTLGS